MNNNQLNKFERLDREKDERLMDYVKKLNHISKECRTLGEPITTRQIVT